MNPTRNPADQHPEPVGPLWRLALAVMRGLPQVMISRITGKLADIPVPRPLRGPIIGGFARAVGARTDEAEKPVEAYRSVNDFFVRRLRPGVLSFPDEPNTLVSPVDGIVASCGVIERGIAIQAKGRPYSMSELLREDAAPWEGGLFLTIYLAPRHYHRIHTPIPGRVARARHVPGRLYPVNLPSVRHVPGLFAINERRVAMIESARGTVGVVAIGAFNVGRISTAFEVGDELPTGADLMAFHLGSTVVLAVPPNPSTPVLHPDVAEGCEVRAGTPLVR